MSDLISRKAVESTVRDYFKGLINKGIRKVDVVDCNAELQKELDGIEVAYDVDKVVEQLEKMKHPYTTFPEGYGTLNEYDYYIDKAITIAKGAVKE